MCKVNLVGCPHKRVRYDIAFGWNRPNVKAQCLLFTYTWLFYNNLTAGTWSMFVKMCYIRPANPWNTLSSQDDLCIYVSGKFGNLCKGLQTLYSEFWATLACNDGDCLEGYVVNCMIIALSTETYMYWCSYLHVTDLHFFVTLNDVYNKWNK